MLENNEDHMKEAKRRIDFVLNHPANSEWLKDSLRKALDRDPIEVVNDLEVLNTLLRTHCELRTVESLQLSDTSR